MQHIISRIKQNKSYSTRRSLLGTLDPDKLLSATEYTTPTGLSVATYLAPNLTHNTQTHQLSVIQLTFQTTCHALAIPTDHTEDLVDIDPDLEKVDLEGNYSSFFQLFIQPDNQVNIRYMSDPVAMKVTIVFFKQCQCEINQNTLFVLSCSALLAPAQKTSTYLSARHSQHSSHQTPILAIQTGNHTPTAKSLLILSTELTTQTDTAAS